MELNFNILCGIAINIRDSDFFSPIYNSSTDIANTSQLGVCIRSVDGNLNANEEFIGLIDMPHTEASSIVFKMKDVLQRNHMNNKKCRGQCHNGCSTMSGFKKKWRCNANKEEENSNLCTHCYAHSPNLAICDAMNACPVYSLKRNHRHF